MSDIRYVCISDMHLGEEDSILTEVKKDKCARYLETDPLKTSRVMRELVKCLRTLLSTNDGPNKPTLILNGDILELALANDNEAMMVFLRFIHLIMPEKDQLFSEIIFVPGNHDHHLWELARETQYIDYINNAVIRYTDDDGKVKEKIKLKPGDCFPEPWHTTNMVPSEKTVFPPSFTLTNLVQKFDHLKNLKFEIKTAYPNYALIGNNGKKMVVFNHGHYVESLYHLMTDLKTTIFPNQKKPKEIWNIEKENFAWIDFFWSALGRSGTVGEDVERIYESLSNEKAMDKIVGSLAGGLAGKTKAACPSIIFKKAIIKRLLKTVIKYISARVTKKADYFPGKDVEDGLIKYINGPLYCQIQSELQDIMPSDLTFIFGHTHKPFEDKLIFDKFSRWVHVYNTGGWVVESTEPDPCQGASIVLVDAELNCAALRMYNESGNPEEFKVTVEQAGNPKTSKNPMYERLSALVEPERSPWRDFSDSVSQTLKDRRDNLKNKIRRGANS